MSEQYIAPTDEAVKPDKPTSYDETEATNATIAKEVAKAYSKTLAHLQGGERTGGIDLGSGWMLYVEKDGGGVWTRQGANATALELIEQTVRRLLNEVPVGGRERTRSYLNALNRLPSIRQVAAAKLERSAADFDGNQGILNLLNGVLDLGTLKMRPSQAGDLCTKQAPVRYDPQHPAKAPTWERCLRDIFPDEPEVIDFVQEALGYTLLGENPEAAIFVCQGHGGNGKSTVLDTVLRVLGSYGGVLSPDVLVSDGVRSGSSLQPEVYALRYNRMVLSSEPKRGVMNSHRLKNWTGDKTIQVRGMWEHPVELPVTFALWLMTNALPEVTEHDDAVKRRMVLIPFRQKFLGNDRILDMGDRLWQERDGIFAWMVEGLRRWQKRGHFEQPEAVRQAVEDWLAGDDMFQHLFGEVFERGSHTRDYVPLADFQDALAMFVEQHAEDFPRAHVNRKFVSDLVRYCGLTKRTKSGQVRVYGVKLNANDGETDDLIPTGAVVPLTRDMSEACYWVMSINRGMRPLDIANAADAKPGGIYVMLNRMAEHGSVYKDGDGLWLRSELMERLIFSEDGREVDPWYSKLLLHRMLDLAVMGKAGRPDPATDRFRVYLHTYQFGRGAILGKGALVKLAHFWERNVPNDLVRLEYAEPEPGEGHEPIPCLALRLPRGWKLLPKDEGCAVYVTDSLAYEDEQASAVA